MLHPSKAVSVDIEGRPDGFEVPLQWAVEVLGGGYTRLVVSAPTERLGEVHQALVSKLAPPLRVLYVQLTDRAAGKQLERPQRHVALELDLDSVISALLQSARLVYGDARHQIWVQGAGEDKVVLEETGVIYVYPDDPSFRDSLEQLGVPEGQSPTMADRDYVRVNFLAEADAEELGLQTALGLIPWNRM